MRRVALLLLLLAACKTTSSAESHSSVDATQQTDTAAAKVVTQRVETGEQARASGEKHEAASGELVFDKNGPLVTPKGDPNPHGRLLRARFRGPVDSSWLASSTGTTGAETRTEAARTTETHAEVKGETEGHTAHSNAPAGIFGGLLALWPLLLLGALAVAAVVGWRVIRGRA